MARMREAVRLLEEGTVEILYRPRVEEQHPEELDDVQRLLIVLEPRGRRLFRLIAIGRKRIPRPESRTPFWGFVDAVLQDRRDLAALLTAKIYGTKSRGIRHLPAARPAASGTYRIEWHGGHAHLRYALTSVHDDDPVVRALRLSRISDTIVTVANPDPSVWGLVELPPLQYELFDEVEVHVEVPTPFPADLQSRFGDRRFAQLDTTDWLDHAGAELVFVEASAAPPAGSSRSQAGA